MTLLKKETILSDKFEKKMIALINTVKALDMPETSRVVLLEELRRTHNSCLEWSEPKKGDFEIMEGMEI